MKRSAHTAPLRAAVLAAALLLAGCGGGIAFGFNIGDDDFDDDVPSVQLAADRDSAAPGGAVQLIAAASDDDGVDSVAFYRVADDGTRALLGSDRAAPYQWSTTLPGDAIGVVRFVARATDGFGRHADSEPVSVTVEP